ncbi:MAG TPA: hypothetical protein VE030_11120 [Burkholderiales bacterium]|nr:hypothetical protein [Burkholderiales bacterium]
MSTPIIIVIGDVGTGGWWYAIEEQQIFGDGFPTETAAIAAAATAAGAAPYEIWYRCEAEGRTVMVPGARSANHPEEGL